MKVFNNLERRCGIASLRTMSFAGFKLKASADRRIKSEENPSMRFRFCILQENQIEHFVRI